jgi:hypothetical protein
LSFALAEFPSQLRLRDIGDLPTGTHRQFGQPFGEGIAAGFQRGSPDTCAVREEPSADDHCVYIAVFRID